jgi:hypothetical protein
LINKILGKVTAEDVEEIEKLFKGLDVEEKNEMPGKFSESIFHTR